MLPGLSMPAILLSSASGGVAPGALPSLPVEDVVTISNIPADSGSWSYSWGSAEIITYPSPSNGNRYQYRKLVSVSGAPKTHDLHFVGVSTAKRLVRDYRWGNHTGRGSNRRHGILGAGYDSIIWSGSSANAPTGGGFSGSAAKTWWSGSSEPINGPYEQEAKNDFLSNLSSWLAGETYLKFRGDVAYYRSTNRVYSIPMTIPVTASGTVTSGTGDSVLLSESYNKYTRLIDVLPSGKILSSIRHPSHNPTTLHIHNADGSLDESRSTATTGYIECGAYNALHNVLALVGNDNVLSYYSMSDLTTPIGTISLPYLPDDIAWPNGEPLFLFFGASIDCLKP